MQNVATLAVFSTLVSGAAVAEVSAVDAWIKGGMELVVVLAFVYLLTKVNDTIKENTVALTELRDAIANSRIAVDEMRGIVAECPNRGKRPKE